MTTKTNQKKWVKTLQFFAAYLVAAWTLLQFVDWILNRYNISPHWVDILLWFFIGIIPSLLIYLYHQERINQRILKLREKIIIPLNIILVFTALYFGFGNSDLGATTRTIDYTNEQGERKSALITKEEFRTQFPIFNFEPKTKDSTTNWLEFGISVLLNEDLLQNKNLSPNLYGFKNTVDKVRATSRYHDFYVDGEFEIHDSTYTITTFIRNAKNGKVINEQVFKGADVLKIIDDITVFITDHFTSDEFNRPSYIDLDVEEFTSSSLKALEYYRYSQYEEAIKEDSTFALAYLNYGKIRLNFNQGKFEERKLADKAYEYRSKLPLQKQGETLILKNLAYDQFDNAEALIKLQLEVDPSDDTYNYMLYSLYGRTRNLKAYKARAYENYDKRPNYSNGMFFLDAALIYEDYDKILNTVNKMMLLNPNDDEIFIVKLQPQLLKGDIKAAEATLKKMRLLWPDDENTIKVYDKAIAYLKEHEKISKEDLKKFEGEYRSDYTEQTETLWVENNQLLTYVSNQPFIRSQFISGDNILVSGSTNHSRTWEMTFLSDENNRLYAFKLEQNDQSNSFTQMYWKINEAMKKAESLLGEKKLDSAELVYTSLIKANPKHFFLKDGFAQVQYLKNVDSLSLINQFKEVIGTYGPRRFWIEDGKLFYKREIQNGETSPKIELFPVSKYKYINLSRYRNQFEFEVLENGTIASFAWDYDAENEVWAKLDNEGNYLLKDE